MFPRVLRKIGTFLLSGSTSYRASDGLQVMRCGELLLPLSTRPQQRVVGVEDLDARDRKLVGWVSSGQLTWAEAEMLNDLDETSACGSEPQ